MGVSGRVTWLKGKGGVGEGDGKGKGGVGCNDSGRHGSLGAGGRNCVLLKQAFGNLWANGMRRVDIQGN